MMLTEVDDCVKLSFMATKTKSHPAKIQGSEVVRIRVSGDKYSRLIVLAKQEKRKLTNLAQVMIEEGIERRA